SNTMTGDTKPVHQFGGSTLVTCGWAPKAERDNATAKTMAVMIWLAKREERGSVMQTSYGQAVERRVRTNRRWYWKQWVGAKTSPMPTRINCQPKPDYMVFGGSAAMVVECRMIHSPERRSAIPGPISPCRNHEKAIGKSGT